MAGANGGRRIPRRRLLAGGAVAGVAAAGGGVAAWLGMRGGSGPPAPEPTGTPAGTATATSFVRPTPFPARTSTQTATVTPIPDPGLIEAAGGEWVVQHFAPGEAIAFNPGICFMAPDGDVLCYRFAPSAAEFGVENYRCSDDNRWISSEGRSGSGLYDRRNDREYRWPHMVMATMMVSGDFIVFSRATPDSYSSSVPPPINPYFVMSDAFERVADFEIPDLPDRFPRRIWKRGPGTACLVVDRLAVRHLDLSTGEITVVYEPEQFESYELRVNTVEVLASGVGRIDYAYVPQPQNDDVGRHNPDLPRFNRWVLVEAQSGKLITSQEQKLGGHAWFSCVSPDARFIAYESWLHSGPLTLGLVDAWPATVVARADTGEPLFRLRSVRIGTGDFLDDNRWLADSTGFTAYRVPGNYGIVGLAGSFAPLPLPPMPSDGWYLHHSIMAPVPSPTDPDLFSYGRIALYNRATGTWHAPPIPSDGPGHLGPWGNADAEEMRTVFPHGGHDGGGPDGMLAAKLEFPPFDDRLRVRVAGAGSCLNLRALPSVESEVLDCVTDGTLLTLEPEPGDSSVESPTVPYGGAIAHRNWQDAIMYARAVTGDGGMAGWVALEYLEWA